MLFTACRKREKRHKNEKKKKIIPKFFNSLTMRRACKSLACKQKEVIRIHAKIIIILIAKQRDQFSAFYNHHGQNKDLIGTHLG